MATISTKPMQGRPAGYELTVAQAQIDLAARLADVCAQPPRWLGELAAGGPAASAFFVLTAANCAWVDAAAVHPRIGAVDVSIEAEGVFAAIEASKATGRVQVVIAGAGPGTLGLLWAVPAAKAQGAKVLVFAPRTPPDLVDAVDVQESSCRQPLHMAGVAVYDEVISMESVAEMPRIAMRLRQLFSRPQGAVVMLCAPTSVLKDRCPALPDIAAVEIAPAAPSSRSMARVATYLTGSGGPPAFLIGSGCVPYREELGPLLRGWRAVHFTTPAATACVPGSLGVIGNAATGDIPRCLRELDVRTVVILGSRLGTASGGANPELFPEDCQLVHVDIDPDVTAANAVATWNRPLLSLTSDIGEFLDALKRVVPAKRVRSSGPRPTDVAVR